jgi:hypothetical protein
VADDKLLQGLGMGFMGCVFGVLAGNIFGSYWNYLNVMAFYWVFLGLVVKSARFSESVAISDRQDDAVDSSRRNGHAESPNFWEVRQPASEFSI